ncbi:MAG: glycosyltransferase family 4 protein [Nocardioidaceae bacterium]
MRVGMVCPYSLDVPGGVQNHVHDLTLSLQARGHEVSVLAPADDDAARPPYVVSAGRAVPVRYNGSVARLAFGPVAMARTLRWVRDGDFDVLHVHEPATPSVSLMALGVSTGVAVATFHTSTTRSRAMAVSEPILRPALEKLSARIAVSEHAQRVIEQHLGGDSVVIPNGLFVDAFARPRLAGDPAAPTVLFLGRFEEPRKGLRVLLDAMYEVLERLPGARLVVAGSGERADALSSSHPALSGHVEFLGRVDDDTRARLLAGADAYVAPNTGGESFGIVLIEAMAAGAPVVASDIPAFVSVLEHGRLGALFGNEDAADLAKTLLRVLDDPATADRAAAAREHVRRYDWSVVTQSITRVYDAVLGGPS